MLIAGTMWLIFSLTMIVLNQIYNDIFSGVPNMLILVIAIISLFIGGYFYFDYFSKNKKEFFHLSN